MPYYRVYGCTGQYSDYTEWTVGCTTSKEEADAKCQFLNNWVAENKLRYDSKCPHDPQFKCWDGDTKYQVEEIQQLPR